MLEDNYIYQVATGGNNMKKGKQIIKAIVLIALFAIVVNPSLLPFLSKETAGAAEDTIKNTFAAFQSGNSRFSVPLFLSCLAIVLFVWIISTLLRLLLKTSARDNRTRTIAGLLDAVIKYAGWITAILWVLARLGVNVAGIFAGLGIVTLVLGFSAESLIEDVITGIFMIFEGQYDVGDIIVIDDFRGRVRSIGVRTTTIQDDGGNLKVVNNSDIRNFQNRSREESLAVCVIGIPYDSDIRTVEKIFNEKMPDLTLLYPDIFKKKAELRGIEEFADSAMVLKFTAECGEGSIFKAKRLLNREIKILFDSNGIEVPFPQVDVHRK